MKDFIRLIFYSQAFWQYFHNEYVNLAKRCPADKVFFEHSWILVFIKEANENITITDLVKISNKNQPAISRAVATLIKAGLVKKVRNKRSYDLYLTENGEKIYNHLKNIYGYLNDKLMQRVNNVEVNNLLILFKQINEELGINLEMKGEK